AGKPGPLVLDADATPPLAASAKFVSVGVAVEVHASTSVMRVQLASAWVTLMRMRSVGNGVNVTLRLTRLLPATVASVTQLVPLYPCTWKSVMPRSENVVVSVGSTGAR